MTQQPCFVIVVVKNGLTMGYNVHLKDKDKVVVSAVQKQTCLGQSPSHGVDLSCSQVGQHYNDV